MTIIEQIFQFWNDYRFLIVVILLGLWIIAARYIVRHVRSLLGRVTPSVDEKTEEVIDQIAPLPLGVGLVIIGIWIAAELSGISIEILFWIRKITLVGIIGIVAIFSTKIMEEEIQIRSTNNIDLKNFSGILQGGARISIWAVAFLLIFETIGVSTLPLIVTFAIFLSILGFTTRDPLTNIVTAFVVRNAGHIKIGSRVTFPKNISGTIREIGWLTTEITTSEGKILRIPNKTLTDVVVEIVE